MFVIQWVWQLSRVLICETLQQPHLHLSLWGQLQHLLFTPEQEKGFFQWMEGSHASCELF